jgi:uncharacterized protein
VLLGEPDAPAILTEQARAVRVVSSRLLRVELRRLGLRAGRAADADRLLAGVALVPLHPAFLSAAETLGPPGVGTLDAIHLATALALASDGLVTSILTYDRRLADAARAHGLAVVAP